MEQQIQDALMEIRERLATLTSEVTAVWKRIDEQRALVETVHTLALSIERQSGVLEKHTLIMEKNTKSISELERKVDDIEAKPAKRWESVVAIFITAVVTFLISKFGLK